MFTGLIETIGTVRQATGSSPLRLTVASSLPTAEVAIGDSIAIDGCCLTVVAKRDAELTFEAATETLARTTLGALAVSQQVNLERALRVGERLDGHFVTGHVDGLGRVASREQRDSALYLGIEAPPDLAPLIAAQGSVAVAGVSLTVTKVEGARFYVGLIPHTLRATTLGAVRVGARLNVEADLVARYIARLLETRGGAPGGALTRQFLADKGFL